MPKKEVSGFRGNKLNAQPRFHQTAGQIQPYGTVNLALPLELEEPVRRRREQPGINPLQAPIDVFGSADSRQ